MTPRILLADDHVLVRQGLVALLEKEGFEVVGQASDGVEARRLAGSLSPDIAILDLGMPRLNGIEVGRSIRQDCPGTRTIALTVHDEDQYVLSALAAGFSGYVLKSQAASQLVRAIHVVRRGKVYLSPSIAGAVVEAYRAKSKAPRSLLSGREREVLQLVAEGKSTKDIAEVLGISAKTAESHRRRIKAKLGIHDTAGLVRYAIRCGLIEL